MPDGVSSSFPDVKAAVRDLLLCREQLLRGIDCDPDAAPRRAAAALIQGSSEACDLALHPAPPFSASASATTDGAWWIDPAAAGRIAAGRRRTAGPDAAVASDAGGGERREARAIAAARGCRAAGAAPFDLAPGAGPTWQAAAADPALRATIRVGPDSRPPCGSEPADLNREPGPPASRPRSSPTHPDAAGSPEEAGAGAPPASPASPRGAQSAGARPDGDSESPAGPFELLPLGSGYGGGGASLLPGGTCGAGGTWEHPDDPFHADWAFW
jgi:hypothetical protein